MYSIWWDKIVIAPVSITCWLFSYKSLSFFLYLLFLDYSSGRSTFDNSYSKGLVQHVITVVDVDFSYLTRHWIFTIVVMSIWDGPWSQFVHGILCHKHGNGLLSRFSCFIYYKPLVLQLLFVASYPLLSEFPQVYTVLLNLVQFFCIPFQTICLYVNGCHVMLRSIHLNDA